MSVRIWITLLLSLIVVSAGYGQSSDEIVIGNKYTIKSDLLGETREYWVSLPDSYELASQSYKTYPLLIVLDGRSHFRSVSGMLGFMSVNRNGSRRVPEMIVVGVVSTNRERDFTPDKIVTRRENDTGGGDQFLNFLEKELVPVLQDTYRLSSYNILMGHSLGGLLASHAYLKAETIFNAFIAIDPSFGTWDAATMDQKIDSVTEMSFDRFLYIATANWENRNFRNRDRHVRFYEALHSKMGTDVFRAKLEYFEAENHGSVPLVAFYNGMSTLFDGYGLTYRSVTSLEQLTSHFAAISDRLSHDFHPPSELVNNVGYRRLHGDDDQQKSTALGFFELNAKNYPESFNVFDSLGEAYATLGNKTKAIENYRRSLEIYPDNVNAQNQLERLTRQ